ncbi:MAG: indolepyruvate ferredoxin oxidoreductase subunit alpha, partial [Elusimicrobia bacterium]|nr:indolepyruvate ferredoxin oxidoreductase subunit alpha [Elusimicrobiota bacterium]
VIVTADDPNMYSSQNEQDSRNYALAAKLPMLEPSDSEEARDFTKMAFEISEKYDCPVLLRTVTRISHAKSIVSEGEKIEPPEIEGFKKNIKKYVMIPAFARERHLVVEERMKQMAEDADKFSINRIEYKSKKTGFITSGMSYNYVREAFPEASALKLGMVYPFPEGLIKEFAETIENLYVAEELEPFIEKHVKALGWKVEGKSRLPIRGELSSDLLKEAFDDKFTMPEPYEIPFEVPARPPSLCPGCPHRPVLQILNELNMNVSGDIGCYTLAVLPPISAMDTCVEMGASIGITQGVEIAEGENYKNNNVAVIGDSTFAHSGITGLFNAAYNGRKSLVIVLDNGTTAMTGMQPNPFSGSRLCGEKSGVLDYRLLAAAAGIDDDNFAVIEAFNREELKENILRMIDSNRLSLMVVKGKCVINHRKTVKQNKDNEENI